MPKRPGPAKRRPSNVEVEPQKKRHFLNSPPRDLPTGASVSVAKAEFGRRLQHQMVKKGWNQSELARQAGYHMPGKKRLGRDSVSNWVRGEEMPGPVRLHALCKALSVKPEDLVPAGAAMSVDDKVSPLSIRVTQDGNVWLQINQATSMELAMKVVSILEQANAVRR